MTTNTITQLTDPLTDLFRSGAQRLIKHAVEAELSVLLALRPRLQMAAPVWCAKAKGHLHDVWQAESCVNAEVTFDFFVANYGVKYDKAVGKLVKDCGALLVFYDFPAEHWKYIRTTNPIESPFATVRHRTGKIKGWLRRKTGLAMAFKLMISAQTKRRRLDDANRLPEIIQGIAFKNGSKQLQNAA